MSATDKEQHSCKIVGISGSLRPGSYTTLAVALALKGAQELKCETKLINLRDYQLVFCDGKDDESQFPKDVFRLREEVKQAQGIILGTPEYHGGYSGVLKNALDLVDTLKQETDPQRRETMVEPDLIDETLDFGDLWLPLGKAFEWTSPENGGTTEAAHVRVVDPSPDPDLLFKWPNAGFAWRTRTWEKETC